jgi:hypothetical protein
MLVYNLRTLRCRHFVILREHEMRPKDLKLTRKCHPEEAQRATEGSCQFEILRSPMAPSE